MHSFKFTKALAALAVAMTFGALTACNEEPVVSAPPEENTILGQEVGVKRLKVSLPRLSRFDNVIDHVSCRVHLRGRADRVTYPVNTFISADKDSIYIEADDPILSELPHQLYNLNALTFPRKNMTARGEDALAEDTVYVGARLSLEDPNNIRFRSSFNVGANSIGAGTEEDPWIIASGDDFMMRVSDPMTRGETHEGKFFEITRNLNLNTAYVATGKGWEPAGHNNINGGSTTFNGTINGCDNYIENLYCFTDAGYGGLFYRLGEKSYIHNLEMRRVMLSGSSNLGAFACYSDAGCRLDSISVNGTIEGTGDNIGGLIGEGDAAVSHCISSVNISSTATKETSNIGGMIGFSKHSIFTDCIRSGKIDAPQANGVGGYLGGITSGTNENTTSWITTFTRCYTSGIITAGNSAGGFAGFAHVEFTDCHAGATLPMDSYAYTTQWDIFGLNTRMSPMPLEVESKRDFAGGFAGNAPTLRLHGQNSFLYSSPAKPNIIARHNEAGGLAGSCIYGGSDGATFTSNAYVQASGNYVGGVIGQGDFHSETGTFVNNGNVIGNDHTGGVIGCAHIRNDDYAFKLDCKNTGTVKGGGHVGGVIGGIDQIDGAKLENDGNVEGGDYVGGLIGSASYVNLADGSRVSSDGGSLKISGKSSVGGICGSMIARTRPYFIKNYCPVYANIISSEGEVGGLVGHMEILSVNSNACEVFKNHSPVRVSITLTGGDKAGGVIGSLEITGRGQTTSISGFDDNLQATITSAGNYVGGIMGYVSNTSSINFSRCHSFASITSTASDDVYFYGGILGGGSVMTLENLTLSVTHCSYHGSLSVPTGGTVGGIVGMYYSYASGHQMQVEKCYNAGRVDAVNSVGGIVGLSSGLGFIRYCFNMGEVPSVSGRKNLAGIVGHVVNNGNVAISIEQCYNVGKTGWGIIGGDSKSAYKLKDCYYLDTASNGDMKNSGSKSKTADEMRKKTTYKDWSTRFWTFHDGEAAPTLKDVPMFNEKLPLQK